MLFYRCELQRQNRATARIIEAVATGYAGCKSKRGASALAQIVAQLRA
jgi:hypothetical protein